MKTCGKYGPFLIAAAMVVLESGAALALDDVPERLPGPGVFGLIVAGVAAAILVARRPK